MGQKVNPHALQVGVIKDWDSKWYPEEQSSEGIFQRQSLKDWNLYSSFRRQMILLYQKYKQYCIFLLNHIFNKNMKRQKVIE